MVGSQAALETSRAALTESLTLSMTYFSELRNDFQKDLRWIEKDFIFQSNQSY